MKTQHTKSAPLTQLPLAGARRMFRAVDRDGGAFYFAPDQVASLVPLNDGGCRINLRAGRWMVLPISPDAIAVKLWPTALAAAA